MLDTAKENHEIRLKGTVFQVCDSNDSTATMDVQFGDNGGAAIPVYGGYAQHGFPFEKIFITHSAQASKYLVIAICTDTPDDRVFVDP